MWSLAATLLPDEDRDGEESCGLQPLDGVAADVEDAVLAALGHLLHARDRRPVQVVVVLTRLDELVVLQRRGRRFFLNTTSWFNKAIIWN